MFGMRFRLLAVWACVMFAASVTLGDEVTFTQNTTIGCDDFTWEGYDVTVSGAVVTIDCRHQFASLRIINGGRVVHSPEVGMDLEITGDMYIDAASRVDADGRGWRSGAGPGAGQYGDSEGGGGSYGGAGGNGANGRNGPTYGSWVAPNEMGSGGGGSNRGPGSSGGGLIRLAVGGELQLLGKISANGAWVIQDNQGSGAGSGGGILIIASRFVGAGTVSASGGGAPSQFSPLTAEGGGGRIAITADALDFSGTVVAGTPNSRGHGGGAGTVFIRTTGRRGDLIIDNNGRFAELTEFNGPELINANVIVRNGGRLGHPPAPENPNGLLLRINGDLIVESGGEVYASARGWPADTGPGAGKRNSWGASGGGYGGAGGDGATQPGGPSYGSWLEPNEMGSGGGTSDDGQGGAGGGLIKLEVTGAVEVQGRITASGESSSYRQTGGGSGGGIHIVASRISGTGVILANGGSVYRNDGGGAGGGGRIALYASDAYDFTGSVTASNGDTDGYYGGAGTVYLQTGNLPGDLTIKNNGYFGAATEFTQPAMVDGNVIIGSGARVGHPRGSSEFPYPGLFLTVLGDLIVEGGGEIYAPFRGYGPDYGPGAGEGSAVGGGGAGYGGDGGDGSGGAGGEAYGDELEPVDHGSGGGSGTGAGGWGGGALRLRVGGQFILDGRIDARGGAGSTAAGGGSGGSVYIRTSELIGAGVITADGGAGQSTGGGGAGGRVAVHAERWDRYTTDKATAKGGTGHRAGNPGTVCFYQAEPGGGARVSSSDEVWVLLPDPGLTVTEQIDLMNIAPPAFDPELWTLLGSGNRKNINIGTKASFVCDEVPDPMQLPFVSAEIYLDDADEVTVNNCNSAWYRVTFDLPDEFTDPVLHGWANVDDQGVIFLNGTPITALMSNPGCEPGCPSHDYGKDRMDEQCRWVMTWPTLDMFGSFDRTLFKPGQNELVFAVVGDASQFDPTGLEFEAVVDFQGPPYALAVEPMPLRGGQPATFSIQGATPNSPQYFVYSVKGIGSHYVPQLGVVLDLEDPQYFGSVNADSIGEASLVQRVPTKGRSRFVWFQTAERDHITNVVFTDIQ